jgi:hypothetical protein
VLRIVRTRRLFLKALRIRRALSCVEPILKQPDPIIDGTKFSVMIHIVTRF